MPPPPINVYDVTQPPDTQLANLLGQDLRNLALNVQQRMSFISGPAASVWNPAADGQPLNWTGLLYFATDTGRVLQWNGAAWVDVTATLFPAPLLQSSAVSLTGQNAAIAPTTLYAVPTSGIYRVTGDCIITTAGTNGTIGVTIAWNNGVIPVSSEFALVSVDSVGDETASSNIAFYAVNGTNIQYGTQFNVVGGSPVYSLRLRLEFLG